MSWLAEKRKEALKLCSDVGLQYEAFLQELAVPSIVRSVKCGEAVSRDIISALDDSAVVGLLSKEPVDGLDAFNLSSFNSGSFISVPDGSNVDLDLSLSANGSCFSRNLVVLGEGSVLNLFEDSFSGRSNLFNFDVSEFHLSEGSTLNLVSVQGFDTNVECVSMRRVFAGKDSCVFWSVLNMGSSSVKSDRSVALQGDRSSLSDSELVLGRGGQVIDSCARVSHFGSGTESRLDLKGVLAGHARMNGLGKVLISPSAAQSKSFIDERSMLLSSCASAVSIPSIEILNNDVSAKHAASCAQLDEDSLFYLESRGVSLKDAKRLMVEGFIGSVDNRIKQRGVEWIGCLD